MRKGIALCIALLLSAITLQPALASAPAQPYFSFTLDKRKAAKNEPVVARYQLTRPAKRVFITATDVEGGPLAFSFPQTSTVNAQHTAGVITFTVPVSAATLSPLRMTLNVDGQLRGLNMLHVTCDTPWFFAPAPEGCLAAPTIETPAAIQHFERGMMIWLEHTKSIWVIQTSNHAGKSMAGALPAGMVDRFDDTFVEGMLESDADIAPPAGKLQPVRGFGLLWRSNPWVMHRLGWAIEKEHGYTACMGQSFGGSRNMRTFITLPEGNVLEIGSNYAPVAWRIITVELLKGCKQMAARIEYAATHEPTFSLRRVAGQTAGVADHAAQRRLRGL